MSGAPVLWNPAQPLQVGAAISSDSAITNLKFHRNGQYLVSTTNNSVILIDCINGREKKRINCKTNGIGKLAYTHHESCVIISSDKKQNDIRYLCLYDNRYLRAFDGHNNKITSLSMCPTDDHFLSASNDKSVLMWDLSVSNPVAKLNLPSYSENVSFYMRLY